MHELPGVCVNVQISVKMKGLLSVFVISVFFVTAKGKIN